jgi:hypothetical protein
MTVNIEGYNIVENGAQTAYSRLPGKSGFDASLTEN